MSHTSRHARSSEVIAALRKGDIEPQTLEAALSFRGADQERLFELARESRDASFPAKQVEVRSVVEMSNVCVGGCRYCNMGRKWKRERYTIDFPAFVDLVEHVHGMGRRVLLIQSGENPDQSFIDHVSRCIEEAKSRFSGLVVILCLGNLRRDQYRQLKTAGADRYVLKFEASNPQLYAEVKPWDTLENRLACLECLLSEGYLVGSGNIVGLPRQTPADLVGDLLLIRKYPLEMMSCTTFIPNEGSEFRNEPMGDLDLTLNTMALMRIANPNRLMPTTSSLEKARPGGQFLGLMAGANTVTIHDGTPERLKALFPIYSENRVVPRAQHLEEIVARAGMSLSKEALHA